MPSVVLCRLAGTFQEFRGQPVRRDTRRHDTYAYIRHTSTIKTPLTCSGPATDDLQAHLCCRAAVKSPLLLVLREGVRIAGAELEAGLALPFVCEPVDLVEIDWQSVDEVGEPHPALALSRTCQLKRSHRKLTRTAHNGQDSLQRHLGFRPLAHRRVGDTCQSSSLPN